MPRIELGPYPPRGQILPLYYTPVNYFLFAIALMHLAQAKTRLPEGNFAHWRLGYCLFLTVGLYFSALNLTLRQTIIDFLPQRVHFLAIPGMTTSIELNLISKLSR